MSLSRSLAIVVRDYIRIRFRVDGQIIDVKAPGTAPASLGRNRWNGISVMLLSRNEHW